MLNPELVKRLEKFLTENKMMGTPATVEQIAEAEKTLNVKLPEDYVDFITRFGGTYAGIEVYALGKNQNIITVTKDARQAFSTVDELIDEINNSVVISDDGSGNPILINPSGEVVIYYHDNREREVLAKSLGQLIEDNFVEW